MINKLENFINENECDYKKNTITEEIIKEAEKNQLLLLKMN